MNRRAKHSIYTLDYIKRLHLAKPKESNRTHIWIPFHSPLSRRWKCVSRLDRAGYFFVGCSVNFTVWSGSSEMGPILVCSLALSPARKPLPSIPSVAYSLACPVQLATLDQTFRCACFICSPTTKLTVKLNLDASKADGFDPWWIGNGCKIDQARGKDGRGWPYTGRFWIRLFIIIVLELFEVLFTK